MRSACASPSTLMPSRRNSRFDARAGGEADDAVTAEGGLGDDLRDCLARDRESAELEVQRQVIRHGAD